MKRLRKRLEKAHMGLVDCWKQLLSGRHGKAALVGWLATMLLANW